MTVLATFPSPAEISAVLEESPDPSHPATDLATLEGYYNLWPYPKSLDSWEGFVYADLLYQVGYAYLHHEEYDSALRAWRECPWPAAADGERQALAHLLQEAYEDQTLVIGPPVADLLAQGRIQLGTLLSTLDDATSELSHAASGIGYVVQARVVRPEGLYHLRFEFDQKTLFFVSFLPSEVYTKLRTARTYFQMGEGRECAGWLLRAAFAAHNEGFGPEAFSFLEKAAQLDGDNRSINTSLTNLRVKGVSPTLASRVVVERALFQPEPLSRCAIRPRRLPPPASNWLGAEVKKLDGLPIQRVGLDGRIVSVGTRGLEGARLEALSPVWENGPWPLLMPASWRLPERLSLPMVEKEMSHVRGISVERLGRWTTDLRPVLEEMEKSWPEKIGEAGGSDLVDFALPSEVQLVWFTCAEFWQIPCLLEMELPESRSRHLLAAWWRRLHKRWGARPFSLAEDIIWFQLPSLPDEHRRVPFLADLLNFSEDVADCFEPSMIRSAGSGPPYLFPLPLQMSLRGDAS